MDAADTPVNPAAAGSRQHPSVTTLDNGWLVIAFSGRGIDGQDLFFDPFNAHGRAINTDDLPINLLESSGVVGSRVPPGF